MIPISSGARVWLVTGHTDMRKGFDGLALIVQETLRRDPHSGHLFVFRGRRGSLIKCLWSDGQGLCLFSKRLERGRFLWPSHRLAHAARDMASDGGRIGEKGSYSDICWYGPFPIAPAIQFGGSRRWPQPSRARRQPR